MKEGKEIIKDNKKLGGWCHMDKDLHFSTTQPQRCQVKTGKQSNWILLENRNSFYRDA